MSSLSPCSSQNKGVKGHEGLTNLEYDVKINEIITVCRKLLWALGHLKFRNY